MKKLLLLCFLAELITSCSNEKPYTYTESGKDPDVLTGKYRNEDKKKTVMAENDSMAFREAALNFALSTKVYEDTKNEYSFIPESFTIKDGHGVDLASKLPSEMRQKIIAEVQKSVGSLGSDKPRVAAMTDSTIVKQQAIAFGSLKFGMSETEYKKLSKNEREYYQRIGEFSYHVTPSFDDSNRLYMVEFQSLSQDANYIDTDVRKGAENLIDVISAKYGDGDYVGPYPSVIQFNSGFINWIRKWEIGKKKILVGAGEEQSGARFYSFCRIYDKELYNQQEKSLDDKSIKTKVGDSEKF